MMTDAERRQRRIAHVARIARQAQHIRESQARRCVEAVDRDAALWREARKRMREELNQEE